MSVVWVGMQGDVRVEDRIRVCKQEVHNCKVAPLSEMPVFSRVARERGKAGKMCEGDAR